MLDKKPTYEELELILNAREEELNNLKSELSVEKSSVFNDLFIDNHAVMLIIDSETGKIINANHAACKFYGYTHDELVEMNINQINSLPDEQIKQEMFLAKNNIQNQFNFKHKLKNQEVRDVELNSGKIRLQNKELLLSMIVDITERNKILDALHNVQQMYRATIEQSNDAITIADLNGRYIMVNQAFSKMTGYTENELLTLNITDLLPKNINLQLFNQVSRNGDPGIREAQLLRKNGSTFWAIISGSILEIGDKRYVQGIIRDISELKLTELEFNKSRHLNERILESSPNLIYIYDILNHSNIYSNRNIIQYLGYSSEQINEFGSSWFDIVIHPDDAEFVADYQNKFSSINEGDILEIEYRIKHADGQYRWLKCRDILFTRSNENVNLQILGIAEDITYRKNFELEIIKEKEKSQENEQRLKLATISGQLGIWDWNVKDNIMKWDDRMFELFGYTPQSFSNNVDAWINGLHPEDKERAIQECNDALYGVRNFDTTFRVLQPNGNVLYIKADGIVIRDIENKPFRMIGINKDITSSKLIENELIKAKERAQESDRLKTAFLQNVSHEIRTPMNAIMGFSELLAKNYTNKSKVDNFSEIIKNRCQDLLNIINDLLDIAKIESGQLPVNLEKCNLKLLFDELFQLFRESKKQLDKPQIKLITDIPPDSDKAIIITDKGKIKQIFINLISNAFKFTTKGIIKIGYRIDDLNNFVFYVSDTGIGIPHDKKDEIFDRFIQLENGSNRTYGGTGLGLSIVKGLLNLLGGNIWLESELKNGSTFYFSLLTVHASLQLTEDIVNENISTIQFTKKKVLLVEDDITNALYFKEILSGFNLEIIHATFGEEAILISLEKELDLILMDIRLPDMSGYEATNEIKKHKPYMKIIAQTAYASFDEKQKALNAGCIDYISKPFTQDMLINMINKHLS